MRTGKKWRQHQTGIDISDQATALAYLCWQIALAKTKQLHIEDFVYSSDQQRTGVLIEYLSLLVHVSDRLVYNDLTVEQRQTFVSTLGSATARHVQRNLEDVYGRDIDYRGDYIDTLNQRISEYSECQFDDMKPGFEMLRGFARRVQNLMGEDQTNRWVIDQIMALDAPNAVIELKTALDNLFGSATSMKDLGPLD
jgi:hypothetical protein